MMKRSDTWLLSQLTEELHQKIRKAREVTKGGPDSERIPTTHQDDIYKSFVLLQETLHQVYKR